MEDDKGRIWLVNKPLEWTSFDVVHKLRAILQVKKIGHAGTLDPLATGLLILCSGKMTKQLDEFQGLEKEYTGTLILGQTTPSYDLETAPTPPQDISHINESVIKSVARSFLGSYQQTPPIHSSIKVNGRRAYELARKGMPVELKSRAVEIRTFEITRIKMPAIEFRVVCSKGTYVRSLANDVGKKLGVGAYLSQLCRTRIGTYELINAQTLDSIRDKVNVERANDKG